MACVVVQLVPLLSRLPSSCLCAIVAAEGSKSFGGSMNLTVIEPNPALHQFAANNKIHTAGIATRV